MTFRARAWRGIGPREVALLMAGLEAWNGTTPVTSQDAELDDGTESYLALSRTVNVPGTASVTEDTEILTLTAPNAVETGLLSKSFAIDDTMRKQPT